MAPLFKIAATFLIAFLLSVSFVLITKAQTGKTSINKLYIQAGSGASSRSGINVEIGLQAVIKNKWSASFSYHSLTMNPHNLPADYKPGSGVVFFIPVTDNIKADMNIFSFTGGKYFPFGRKCWITTEAGVSLVNGDKVDFKRATSESSDPLMIFLFTSYTTSNYSTAIEKKTSLGGMIKADINWAFAPFVGMSVGTFANFNSIQSPVGFNLKLTLGKMGIEKKHKREPALLK
jgi:hypothetical protein